MAIADVTEQLVKQLGNLTTNLEHIMMAPYGQQGALVIYEPNVQHDGSFYCIVALADDVKLRASLTKVNWEFDSNSAMWNTSGSDMILPVGLPLYGDFSSVGLIAVSGAPDVPKLICYKK